MNINQYYNNYVNIRADDYISSLDKKFRSKALVDPNVAAGFLINGISRNILLESIAHEDKAIIKTLNNVKLSKDERLFLIRNIVDQNCMIPFLSNNQLSLKERLLLISNRIGTNFAYQYVARVDMLTEEEEEYIVQCFISSPDSINNLFKNKNVINKFSIDGIAKLKEYIFNDRNRSRQYIEDNPDAIDRNKAFETIFKTATGSYDFLLNGYPTKEERRKLLEKLALSRTYFSKILNNHSFDFDNHDRKILAQSIREANDLHQAKIMLNICSEQNILHILEPLKMVIILMEGNN